MKGLIINSLTNILLFVSVHLAAKTTNELQYRFETSGIAGTGANAPFWHTSNRQGLPSIQKNNGYMRNAVLGNIYDSNGWCFDYGLDIGAGVGLESNLFVHQLFIDVDYKWLGVSAGIKERWCDKNPKLSSGALTWSGNSKPIPEFRAGIPEYVRIPILKNWLSIKGHIGYGRLTDDKWRKEKGNGYYAEGILFHSKSVFIRLGDEDRFPLQMTLGLEMNNMFGGTQYKGEVERHLPSDAAMYWTVLFPFHPVGKQGNEDGDNLGSWHLNFDYKFNDWHIGAYYEHFYEDQSAMLGIEYKNNADADKGFAYYGFRHNWLDGLFGIEINAPDGIPFFEDVVFEFMNTRGQCGPIMISGVYNTGNSPIAEEIDGRDNMYNHTTYDSYSHWGYAIGNPVLISPVYNEDGNMRFRSNRVQMFHLGVDGGITRCIDYRLLATTTQHWGCYGAPLKEVERVTSVMMECSYKFGGEYGWRVSLSGAADFDSGSDGAYLLGNNRGVMVTVSRTWKVL